MIEIMACNYIGIMGVWNAWDKKDIRLSWSTLAFEIGKSNKSYLPNTPTARFLLKVYFLVSKGNITTITRFTYLPSQNSV